MDYHIYWNDGIYAALKLLEQDYDIDYVNVYYDHLPPRGEILLAWGGFSSKAAQEIKNDTRPKALCFAGGTESEDLHKFDLLFVEEAYLVHSFRDLGVNPMIAFGTNTQLFKPMKLLKRWDYIYPAAFAGWKRHDRFCQYVTEKNATGLVVGFMQPNRVEADAYESLYNKVDVLPRVTPDVLVYLYNMSHNVLITSEQYGGGQRAVLEAMACQVPIVTEMLNPRLLEVYKGGIKTEVDYYQALKKGLQTL